MFDISPEQVAVVFVMVELIRAWLPSSLLNLDGKLRVWIVVGIASVLVVAQDAVTPDNVDDALILLRSVATLTVASVMANGAVVASGLQAPLRSITTVGGRLPVNGSDASGSSS